ncbi:MAG: hypothetical protein QM706_03510 [Nitrospira sp.]
MRITGTTIAPLTIAILSRQCLVWLGLQKILEGSTTLPMVVQPHPWRTPDGCLPRHNPMCLSWIWRRSPDAIGILTQIRAAAPTSRLCCYAASRSKTVRASAFAAGVDGILLE